MTHLSSLVVLVLVLSSLLLFSIERLLRRQAGLRTIQTFFQSYACLLLLLLVGFGVAPHLGVLRRADSPRLDPGQQRSIHHVGYYAAPGQAFTFRGARSSDGILHAALADSEYIRLTPVTRAPLQAETWQLDYHASSQPLRVDKRCINLPEAWWLDPGDVIQIVRRSPEGREDFVEIRWHSRRLSFLQSDRYFFSHGERTAGGVG